MSERFPAAVMRATPVVPSLASAPGVWTMEQQLQAQAQGIWPVNPGLADPYFDYVSLLLHGDGTNGAQNNTFVDSSSNNFTITRNGNTTQGSFSPFGTLWSNFFDGTGDYLIPTANGAFALGTGDFTIEGWFFPGSASATQGIMGCGPGSANSWQVFANLTAGKVTFNVYGGTAYVSTNSFTVNTWNHFAIVRSGGTIKVYLNGVGNTGVSNANNFTVTNLVIGRSYYNLSQEHFLGNVSNIRIVKSAVYSDNFTQPASPLTAISNTVLLTCQSNRFVDNSATGAAITRNGDVAVSRFSPFAPTAPYDTSVIGGSSYHDGTGDYLSTTLTGQAPGTGNFTYECYFYVTSLAAQRGIMNTRSGDTTDGFDCGITTSGAVALTYSFTALFTSATGVVTVGQWYHLAIVRTSTSVVTVYLNGVSLGNWTAGAGQNFTSTTLFVGAQALGGLPMFGHISNFRYTRSAIYTGAFTPPAAPLTAITNTGFLAQMTNAAIFDNAMQCDVETVGSAQIGTSVKKYGTGALPFDGVAGDALVSTSSSLFNMGTGNFTIECWVYPLLQSKTYPGVFNLSGVADLSLAYDHSEGANDSFSMLLGGTRTSASSSSAINSWHHVAIVRNGSTVTLYVNGVGVAAATNSSVLGGSNFVAGMYSASTLTTAFKGYIDDLRVTKGVARYTANFTPPAAPFNNQ